MFHDIICRWLDALIGQLSLNTYCIKNKRNVKVPHRGLSVQQQEDLLAVLNGPASFVSQFLLFESDILQVLPIQYLEEERILC